MSDDEPFLSALQADPDDRTARRVYADWLTERDRPREAEYVRLAVSAAELPHGPDRAAVRSQMLALQPNLPLWWCALVGGVRSSGSRTGGSRVWEAEAFLGRDTRAAVTDANGYALELVAAATCGRTGALAYVEQRSKSLPTRYDDGYVLVLRDTAGRTAETPVYVYSTYAEFDIYFLEWWGGGALLVYREKHHTYAIRLGFDGPARSQRLGCWLIDDRELAHIGRGEAEVKRFALPDLDALPALSIEDAMARDLMPKMPTWWR